LGNENFRPPLLLIKAAALPGPPLAVTAAILSRELKRTQWDLGVANSNGASKRTISELFGYSPEKPPPACGAAEMTKGETASTPPIRFAANVALQIHFLIAHVQAQPW
jgi:hypothetical protein